MAYRGFKSSLVRWEQLGGRYLIDSVIGVGCRLEGSKVYKCRYDIPLSMNKTLIGVLCFVCVPMPLAAEIPLLHPSLFNISSQVAHYDREIREGSGEAVQAHSSCAVCRQHNSVGLDPMVN